MAGGDDPDLELVVRAGRGDPAAVQALVARKLPRVLTLAARMLGDSVEAEDVSQEAFLRVWRQAPRWRSGGARFDTWLHTVTLNLCRDRLRRRRPEPLEAAGEGALIDPAPTADAALAARDREAAVAAAIAALPVRQREALVLTTWQGLSNPEAAKAMGVSVEAVESLLARARRTLRSRLADLRACA